MDSAASRSANSTGRRNFMAFRGVMRPGSAPSGAGLTVRRLRVVRRPAPAGQIIRLVALGQAPSLPQCCGKVVFDQLALHTAAQKIGPEKFVERSDILGVAARHAQLPCETAIWVIGHTGNFLWDIVIATPLAITVIRVHPTTVIHEHPEFAARLAPQIRHDRGHDTLDALAVQSQHQVMMVEDVGLVLRAHHDWNQVRAEEFGLLAIRMLAPSSALGFDFPDPYSHLSGTQAQDLDRINPRLSGPRHLFALIG